MQIKLNEITISEVVKGYKDSAENGVVGYDKRLNIRPAFQREFIYGEKQRDEVIKTIRSGFPLNVMYWSKNGEDFELLDGQQRTISVCQYINNDYSINYQYFHNLTFDEQQQILDYKMMIYFCEGTDKEKLDWFKIINIAGMQLKPQELKNAIYTGEWLTAAKKYFSKENCAAHNVASIYIIGSANRQDFLEAALSWIADKEGKEIDDYMAEHQHESTANELWLYFSSVINWVNVTFPKYRREMKGLDWGIYYNKFGAGKYDPKVLESKIVELIDNDDVTRHAGIYEYLFDGDEKHLSIRKFTEKMKRSSYERKKGICPVCKKHFEFEEMEGDHITPWHEGGKTIAENCQMLCKDDNRRKSGI
ncbi:MAG: HNH endonuclease [Clostridiales bacterium GWB2_37_7]|nr:MAG: HNH endonuclease [Clostridiales bacterium GWB2_37_7]